VPNKDYTRIVYPLITLAILLFVWEFTIRYFQVPEYIFPSLGSVGKQLYVGYIEGTMYQHLGFTLQSMVIGYLIGCSLALILGVLIAESVTFEKFIFPFVVALQSTPKVAIAPLIMLWCGYGLLSKVVMVAIISFFPLFVNTVAGIRQTDPALIRMMRAFSASSWLTFHRVKLYAAAGHIFAGLQISIVMALIGAVVGEFVGSAKGLGWLIQSGMATFNAPIMFAAVLSLIFLGLAFTALVKFAQRKLVYWDRQPSGAPAKA